MLAFDRSSKRTIDANGFMHVSTSHISKETVNPYMGKEIPGFEELGLDPDRVYNCWRKGSELAKAADTFNGLPILWGHKAESAEAPQKKDRIGSMGTDAAFKAPFLDNSLSFTDKRGVDAIESGKRVELSCSYRWVPVVKSGAFDGQPYDIIMTQIKGNHLGLVEEGRAGSDVMVHDEKPKGIGLVDRIKSLAASIGLLASDESLGGMEKKEDDIIEKIGEQVDEFKSFHTKEKAMEEKDKAMDAEGMKKMFEGMSKDEMKSAMDMCKDMMAGKKADDEEMSEEDKAKAAKDEEDKKAKDMADKKAMEDEKAKNEEIKKSDDKAMDEKIKLAKDEAVKSVTDRYQAISAAAEDVRPIVGIIANPLSFDSAEALYGKALTMQGQKIEGIEPSAYKGMFQVLKSMPKVKGPSLANDQKTTEFTGAFAGLATVNIEE